MDIRPPTGGVIKHFKSYICHKNERAEWTPTKWPLPGPFLTQERFIYTEYIRADGSAGRPTSGTLHKRV